MKLPLPLIAFGLIALLLIVGGFAYERMLWNECRADHSWFYCVRVLGSK
jgi:hypothetical protein